MPGQIKKYCTNTAQKRVFDAMSDNLHNPAYQKTCPICGKIANSKYYSEEKKAWIYRHQRLYQSSIIHEANS